jgi:hypothetical protein
MAITALKDEGRSDGIGFDDAPLENPRIETWTEDPLLEPHPDEPGVRPDGYAAPLENPGDPFRQ